MNLKNKTAFLYYNILNQDCSKIFKKIKKGEINEKNLRNLKEFVECIDVLGSLAFGEKEFNMKLEEEINAKALSKQTRAKKGKEDKA